ncbi:Mu transposase C-terminal domain-containing protein [Pseudomonas viridiflava]|uniref:Mu transposase C-terminal domain-containing protein n=1 Tax=Pseudomonas viridiflava TaxID=33069 RepID=UPI000F03C599|nr:Mu transposase C-terminal domain-containing protein [Pseudomonas viridiflava]
MSWIENKEHALVPYEPNRARLNIDVNSTVRFGDNVYRISQILDFKTVIGIDVESGRAASLAIAALIPVRQDKVDGLYANYDLSAIASEDWAIAQRRFAAIEPLLGHTIVGRKEAEQRARETGVDAATLYRWLGKYNEWGELLALVPRKRGWQTGNSRISREADELITKVIKDYYLTKQRPSVQKAIEQVRELCDQFKIPPPSATAIRARIKAVSDRDYLRGRGFSDKARNKYTPSPGTFPGADYPLAIVQVDHTPIDVMLVDDVHRLSIGRLWLTLAICVHTRMITGYYLALDAPSGISVAMCVAHAALPKEEWLTVHGIEGDWPVWGFPSVLHTDNGPDFQAETLKLSCSNYGIENRFRPVKRPKYGGHIERLLGKFMDKIHALPGTTFSNVSQREGYDSDKQAVMSVSEFETWLVREILKYNESYHSKIFMSPSRKWHIGIFGNTGVDPLVGLPMRPADPLTVQRDFLPSYERTIQHYGVELDVRYYSEALRPWINAKDEQTGKTRKFIFRRDPRDISLIWFYDPLLKQYFKVPVANQAFPAASVWEYRAAKKKAVEEGQAHVNEDLIKRYILENRDLVLSSEAKTKKARREAQRHRVHAKKVTPAQPNPKAAASKRDETPMLTDMLDIELDSFGDIS